MYLSGKSKNRGGEIKAAVYYNPGNIRVEEIQLRDIAADELLMEVSFCGICGTDIHIFDGTAKAKNPLIPGHEYSGTVRETGKYVKNFKPGDRIAVNPNIHCGHCHFCRRGMIHLCENNRALGVHLDGGFSEYSIVPELQTHPLADNIPMKSGSMVEPLSCCLHGIDIAEIRTGDSVIIIGAGAIGLMLIQLARMSGAAEIIVIEKDARRRSIAEMYSIDGILDPSDGNTIEKIYRKIKYGADAVIECAGNPEAAKLSLQLVKRGGNVIFFGVSDIDSTIEIYPQKIYYDEISIRGSFINPRTFSRAIKLLENNKMNFDNFTFSEYPLSEIEKAIENQRNHATVKTHIAFEDSK